MPGEVSVLSDASQAALVRIVGEKPQAGACLRYFAWMLLKLQECLRPARETRETRETPGAGFSWRKAL